nr:reverse transcriptase domain-containing protein [Tanacetum cinerariifolium]
MHDLPEALMPNELALMCGRMFPEESDQVEKYVGGIPDMIQGSVMASKPKTTQETIEIANDLMDQKVCAYAKRQAENKRKFGNNNQAQQKPPKKQSVAIAYTDGSGERKESDWSELKNQNHGNQAEGTEARGMVKDHAMLRVVTLKLRVKK